MQNGGSRTLRKCLRAVPRQRVGRFQQYRVVSNVPSRPQQIITPPHPRKAWLEAKVDSLVLAGFCFGPFLFLTL